MFYKVTMRIKFCQTKTQCDFSIEVNSKYPVTSETQAPLSTFHEIRNISVIKDQTQQKVLRVESELSAIKSHFKCGLSTLNSRTDLLTASRNGALKKLENLKYNKIFSGNAN